MKRITLLVLVIGSVALALSFSAVLDPETGGTVVSMINGEGRTYLFDISGEEWMLNPFIDPCPGPGPYELELELTPIGGVIFYALDREGQMYNPYEEDWREVGEPIPGDPPYLLSVANNYELDVMLICALDSGGRTWYLLEDEWLNLLGSCPGEPPWDMVYVWKSLGMYTLVVDTEGRIYTEAVSGWIELEEKRIPDGTPPFSLAAHIGDVTMEGAELIISAIDANGYAFVSVDGEMIALDEPCPGEPPFIVEHALNPVTLSYYIYVLDGAGRLYSLHPGGEWITEIAEF